MRLEKEGDVLSMEEDDIFHNKPSFNTRQEWKNALSNIRKQRKDNFNTRSLYINVLDK